MFQILAAAQLLIQSRGEETHLYPLALLGLTGVMWLYYLLLRSFGVRGFEMESIAFFLSTLSLAVTASSAPGSVFKQFVAIVLGPVVHAGAGRGAAGRAGASKSCAG